MTVEEFAAYLGVSARAVGKWSERGASITLKPATQAMLDTALQRAGNEQRARFERAVVNGGLGASASERFRFDDGEEDVDVDRREFGKTLVSIGVLATQGTSMPAELAAFGQTSVDMLYIHRLRAATVAIWERDQHSGGGTLMRKATGCANEAMALVESGDYPARAVSGLMSAASDVAVAAGWVAFDADHHQHARHWYSRALALAVETGDDSLAIQPLEKSVLQAVQLSRCGMGSPQRAVQLSERLRLTARNQPSSRLHALVAARTALAHAAQDDRSAFEHAISSAWREIDHAERGGEPLADTPMWLRFVTAAEVRSHAATGREYLGDLEIAAEMRRSAAEQQSNARNATIERAALAVTLARIGDITAGLTEGMAVLDSLEGNVSSARTFRRLEPLRNVAALSTEGDDFRARFDELADLKGVTR